MSKDRHPLLQHLMSLLESVRHRLRAPENGLARHPHEAIFCDT
jgi:hypothetical protein